MAAPNTVAEIAYWSSRSAPEWGQIWGQSPRPTADFGGLRRTGIRTLVLQRISQRLFTDWRERRFGSLCIVPPSAPDGTPLVETNRLRRVLTSNYSQLLASTLVLPFLPIATLQGEAARPVRDRRPWAGQRTSPKQWISRTSGIEATESRVAPVLPDNLLTPPVRLKSLVLVDPATYRASRINSPLLCH